MVFEYFENRLYKRRCATLARLTEKLNSQLYNNPRLFFRPGKSFAIVGEMKFPKTFSCTGCGSKPRLLGMLAMTASFMLVELIVGNLTNSMALVADSFHMLSDVISLVR